MRSDLMYSAGRKVENRFLLATVAMRAIRALHIDSKRTQDTANQVFTEISQGHYTPASLPAPLPPPFIEPLLVAPAL